MYDITLNPSSEPSMNPSVITVNPSANPSVPSVPPTSVTINPTLPIPTKEPIMESTISLKDTIVTTPSKDEVMGNNAVDLKPYLWIIALAVGICCLIFCVVVC
eukprot:114277_1